MEFVNTYFLKLETRRTAAGGVEVGRGGRVEVFRLLPLRFLGLGVVPIRLRLVCGGDLPAVFLVLLLVRIVPRRQRTVIRVVPATK